MAMVAMVAMRETAMVPFQNLYDLTSVFDLCINHIAPCFLVRLDLTHWTAPSCPCARPPARHSLLQVPMYTLIARTPTSPYARSDVPCAPPLTTYWSLICINSCSCLRLHLKSLGLHGFA
jgi:hypothetical protein